MRIKPIVIIILVAILTGCNGYQKVLKSNDTELKYKKALEFYNEGDYYKAIQLLDNLRSVTRGTGRAEDVFYYYAQAHFRNEEYMLASYYFRTFAKSFPRSEKREEALYKAAYCKYLQAPRFNLDQTITREAIDELQLFVDRYPQSKLVIDASRLINELEERLEKKQYENAMLYHKMERWEVAAYALRVFLDDYPVTDFKEEALFFILDARYNYALNSVREKQKERYKEAIDAFEDLMAEFPESRYKNKAEKLRARSRDALKELN